MFRTGDLFEDFAGRLGPDEWLGVCVVVFQVFHDGAFELRDTLEGAAADTFSGDLGEEPLDHVEPGSRGRREVQMEAGMGFEPALYGRRLMGGVVVNDEMEIETGGGLLVDQSEKAQELAMSMARHAGPDDLAVQHVQRCEQGGGAVALVVVGHGTGTPLLHGQSRLSAVEGLDLALFVDAEDQRLVGRIEVEPDHVLHLGREVLVARDFERFDQMRLEPVRMPDPLDTAVGDPCRRSHAAQAPVGRIRRLRMQRHVDHLLDLLGRQRLDARRAGRILQQPVHPLRHVAAAPATDRQQALAHGRRNPLRCQSIARQQHDPRPPNHLLRRVSVSNQPLQSFAISHADPNLLDFPHRRRLAGSRRFVNRLSATGPDCVKTPSMLSMPLLNRGGMMKGFVQGADRQQTTLLPECLDDWVDESNPVRAVDVFVDALELRELGFDGVTPAATGRPGYHPSPMLKLYIYGYLNRVQSSRRLEREAGRNLEVMWLTGRLVPDHKTIADFRKDNGPAIKKVCAQFVALCRKMGLLAKASVAIDGSKFKAVNSRDNDFTKGKMERRLAQIEASVARYLSQLDTADRRISRR